MTTSARTLGTLRSENGSGVVRIEDRFDTDPADLWSALTDPERLSRWLGTFEGDLRLGGSVSSYFFASGAESTGRIEECDPPRRLRVTTVSEDQPEGEFVVTLTPDGDGTVLVVEDRGVPPVNLAAYGAGDQIHVEDLKAHLAGGDRCDARARWAELHPAYQALEVSEA